MLNEKEIEENVVLEDIKLEENIVVEEENIIIEDINVLEEIVIEEEIVVEVAKFTKADRENFYLCINKVFNKNNMFQLNGKSISLMRFVSKELSQLPKTKISSAMFPVVHYEVISKADSLVVALKIFGLKKDEGMNFLEEKILPNKKTFTSFEETSNDTAVLFTELLLEPSSDSIEKENIELLEANLTKFLSTYHETVTSVIVG